MNEIIVNDVEYAHTIVPAYVPVLEKEKSVAFYISNAVFFLAHATEDRFNPEVPRLFNKISASTLLVIGSE